MLTHLLSICLGLGLAAACGFRVFVPGLVMSLATRAGYLELSDGFSWVGSTPALTVLIIATALEVGGYYIPWVDNLLDTVASPIAVVAGVLVTASVITGMDPFMKWALAIIAGGGVAATTQALTAGTRGLSMVTTAGLGNPVVAAVELASSFAISVLAIVAPVLTVILMIVAFIMWRRRRRRLTAQV